MLISKQLHARDRLNIGLHLIKPTVITVVLSGVFCLCLYVVCNVCIVAKRFVLPKNYPKKQTGNGVSNDHVTDDVT